MDNIASVPRNPAQNTAIPARAGEQALIEFERHNGGGDVVSFYLQVEGAAKGWALNCGPDHAVDIAAEDDDILPLTMAPPAGTTPNDYEFQVKIYQKKKREPLEVVKLWLTVKPPLSAAEQSSSAIPAFGEFVSPSDQASGGYPQAVVSDAVGLRSASSKMRRIRWVPPPAPSHPAMPPSASDSTNATASNPSSNPPQSGSSANGMAFSSPPAATPHFDTTPAASPPASGANANLTAPANPIGKPVPASGPGAATPQTPQGSGANANLTPPAHGNANGSPENQTSAANARVSSSSGPGANLRARWEGLMARGRKPESDGNAPPENAPPETLQPMYQDPRSNRTWPLTEVEIDLANPSHSNIIELRSGQAARIRFPITFPGTISQTYVLQDLSQTQPEDRRPPIGWLEITKRNQTQAGGKNFLEAVIAPTDYTPGSRSFVVAIGANNVNNRPHTLILRILPVPAVAVECEQRVVRNFFGARYLDFNLNVETGGNCDTAFRIGVKAADDRSAAASCDAAKYLNETDKCRYLFDRELDTLKTENAAGPRRHAPPPVPVRLRLERISRWWFGFWDKQTAQVQAVPVTDVANGGKAGNTITVTAIRYRLVPLPYMLCLALIALYLFMGSGQPDTFQVAHPLYVGPEENTYWVAQDAKIAKDSNDVPVELQWEASGWALTNLVKTPGDIELHKRARGSGEFTTHVKSNEAVFDVPSTYTLSPVFLGQSRQITVHCLYTRKGVPVSVPNYELRQEEGHPGIYTFDLPIAEHGYTGFQLKNVGTAHLRLTYQVVRNLSSDSPFDMPQGTRTGFLYPNELSDKDDFKFRFRNGEKADKQEDDFVIATSDIAHPLLRVHLIASRADLNGGRK